MGVTSQRWVVVNICSASNVGSVIIRVSVLSVWSAVSIRSLFSSGSVVNVESDY